MKAATPARRTPAGIVSESDVENALNKYRYQDKTNWQFIDHRIKFDDEDHPVDWFYAAQIVAELMNPSPPLTTLPGAEMFYAFLRSQSSGSKITVTAPIVLDWSYDRDYAKLYKIFVDGKKIGDYTTFGPGPRERNFTREYSGTIPGINARQGKQIGLIWGNKRFVARPIEEGPGSRQKTRWKRQDGWKEIPFP